MRLFVTQNRKTILNSWMLTLYGTAPPPPPTCSTGTYFDTSSKQCQSCHSQCADTCTGPTPFDCHHCLNEIMLNECVDGCPAGTFANASHVCHLCDDECDSCSDSGPFHCKTCKHVAIISNNMTQCVNSCPPSFIDESGICKCALGSHVNENGVCVCDVGRYEDFHAICQLCHPECDNYGCAGPSSSHCLGGCRHAQFADDCVAACPNLAFQSFNKT